MADSTKTEVGSYFISNYPPFSQWESDQLDEVKTAFANPPLDQTPLGLYLTSPSVVNVVNSATSKFLLTTPPKILKPMFLLFLAKLN